MWEAWRTWRRAGRWLASRMFAIAMTVIYLVAAPLTALAAVVGRSRARQTRRDAWLGEPKKPLALTPKHEPG
jgi:hypothetical protein